MRSNKWKEKEFSTETLTQVEVDAIMKESADYASGKVPVSRHTQYAESLEDMAQLQRKSHRKGELRKTHGYGVLSAVKDYNPIRKKSPDKDAAADENLKAADTAADDSANTAVESPSAEIPEIKMPAANAPVHKLPISKAADKGAAANNADRTGNTPAAVAAGISPDSASADNTQAGNVTRDESPSVENPSPDIPGTVPENRTAEDVPSSTGEGSAQEEQTDNPPAKVEGNEPEVYKGENQDFYTELDSYTDFSLQPLTPEDENYEDIMEKFVSAPMKPKFWFKEQGDHWFCSCGHLNKGDYCANCGLGRDLLRSLFVLHEPGDKSGYTKPNYAEVGFPNRGLSKKFKIILALIIAFLMVVAAGIFIYFKVVIPNMEAEAAAKARSDAESMQTNIVASCKPMDTFMYDSYVSGGDKALKDSKYETAIKLYTKALAIKDNDDVRNMIYKAKYGYVEAHLSERSDKVEKYLIELKEIGYGGIDSIYNEYFAWHCNIVANLDKNDTSTDIGTASRSDIVFFHVMVSGGPPDGTIEIYYELAMPNGAKQTDIVGTGMTAGDHTPVAVYNPIPIMAKEGKATFKIYDKTTGKQLGSDTIDFKK